MNARTRHNRWVRDLWFDEGPVLCHWCKRVLNRIGDPSTNGNFCTVDHLLETALGGTDERSNLVPSCADCNVRRSDHIKNPPMGSKRYADVLFEQGVHK